MIICLCHRVSDRHIAQEVAQGCASFDELQHNTRIGTACGTCFEFAKQSFAAQAHGGCVARCTRPEALPAPAIEGMVRPGDRLLPTACVTQHGAS